MPIKRPGGSKTTAKKAAELVAAERERCAKIARNPALWSVKVLGPNYQQFPANKIHREAGTAIADAITQPE